MMFITLEDEVGTINLVLKPDTQARYERSLSRASLLCCTAKTQRNGENCTLLVEQIHELHKFNSPSENPAPRQSPLALWLHGEPQHSLEHAQTKPNQKQQKP